jgi:hypothetical protein
MSNVHLKHKVTVNCTHKSRGREKLGFQVDFF